MERLARSPQMRSVSSFYSVQHAEKAISSALKANKLKGKSRRRFSST
ncbi:hypothetical protein [Klebsiella aerogenes]